MIDEIDAALRAIIVDEALAGADVDLAFDAPTKEWASKRSAPTICAYLYDIREDVRRRESGFVEEYRDGRAVSRHSPPRYFRLSYLVAAWTQRPEDEHGLLARLLRCLINYQSIPTDRLTGSLAELALPVTMTVALPPSEDRSFADVWSALGGELKPSVDVVICAPLAVRSTQPVGPPVRVPVLRTGGMRDAAQSAEIRRRPRIDETPGTGGPW
ncbi:DUF4255 domain-containing protein [Gordonia rhizosphera]|uniref:Pvc16 N-terminal domain-containing protein n=1 Tax=Gordonia rhizosphera NBRC 16068 TaxID=1108045 RepID=K6VR38_9ACTN|nr:DUF4255 domain-containing protein [Gordonia rhizosphera]GAB89345.1 hypothetical protein GORHZ_057_00420 [Gordonia rhizosphera NBRC 16068]